MKIYFNIILALSLMACVGCETMNKGAEKTGEYVGKATKVGDKVSEGAVDGYMGCGAEDKKNNPYGR